MRSRLLLAALAALVPTAARAQSGYAVVFSPNVNAKVNVPLAAPAGPFTLEAWVRAYTSPAEVYGIYTILEFGDDRPFFGVIGERLGLDGAVLAPTPFPANTWQHVAYTFDGTTSRLYQNGVEVASSPTAPPAGGAALGIGYGLGDTAWPGYIDEVIVWNRARTAAEIAADLDGLSAAEIAAPDLLAYFKFDEGAGQTTANAKAGGPNGTFGPSDAVEVNDPAWSFVGSPTDAPAGDVPAGLRLAAPRPSPARTTTAVEAVVGRTGPVEMALYDALGRLAAPLYNGPVAAGAPLRVTVDATALAPGLYFVRLTADGQTHTRPLVVAR